MARRYQLKRRAERQEQTKRRIVEAAVELHTTLGPAQTTISAIAERAGVQRLTVYRHFPDERTLFAACSEYYRTVYPPPDPASWLLIADPEERLKQALAEVYTYYHGTESRWVSILRDMETLPIVREVAQPMVQHWAWMRDVLAAGWKVRGRYHRLLLAALGHALDFQTWRSLVRQQGLSEGEAIELLLCWVRCAVAGDTKPS